MKSPELNLTVIFKVMIQHSDDVFYTNVQVVLTLRLITGFEALANFYTQIWTSVNFEIISGFYLKIMESLEFSK